MTMRSAAAAALLLAACAPNAQPRRAPMVLASAPARVAPPPVIVGARMPVTSGRIRIGDCPGQPRAPITPALFVVDGQVVTPGPGLTLPGIDPDRIADIQILRGPQAVELYGPAASSGVVLITLKHPRRP
jgi:hypothetical protein